MNSVVKRAILATRWGLLGLVSGGLSCLMSQSWIVYDVREQKTLDHIVWPGMVFALVVLLPLSRWAGDGWMRTAAALIASSAIYPIAWRIAVVGIRSSYPLMIATFACAGLLGSFVLAAVFLFGRPRWGRAAVMTVVLGTVIGGLMGASLGGAMTSVFARDGLALCLVAWQTAVAASLGRGVSPRPSD